MHSSADECAMGATRDFRLQHSKNFIISHYNSIRHRFSEISPLIADFHVDILAITDSKYVDGIVMYMYVNHCIPHRLINNHTGNHMCIEFLTTEVSVKSKK